MDREENGAPAWFRRKRLSAAVTLVWEPEVHRFFRANIFHVAGRDADLVVDFGTGLRSLRAFLDIDAGKPVIALATHIHIDHVGSFHEFDQRVGSAVEARDFARMEDRATLADHFRRQPGAVAALPHAGWMPSDYRIHPAPLTRAVSEGARIDLGDRTFSVLHLPGHSPGSIALLDERNGVLFAGDAIYDGTLVDDLPGCDPGIYRATMERLRRLDVAVAYGGHGVSMSAARMHAIADEYLSRAG